MPRYSDDELLEYLEEYYDEHGERPKVVPFRDDDSYPSPRTYQKRFGSWREALAEAGFESTPRYSREELVEAIHDLADELGRPPSRREMKEADGYPSRYPFEAEFGSWSVAIRAAGLDPTETGPITGAALGGMDETPGAVEVTRNPDLEVVFEGSPGDVRSFNYGDEFGIMIRDADPELALDVMASDPSPDATWHGLREVLLTLADAGCNTAEMIDYLAIEQCGIDAAEWAERTGSAHSGTIENNRRSAANVLEETLGDDG